MQLQYSQIEKQAAFKALNDKNISELKMLLDVKPSLSLAKNMTDDTLLHLAINDGLTEIVEYLIVKGSDINAKNGRENSPLMLALIRQQPSTASMLISYGADIDAENLRGDTPLHLAAVWENPDLALMLLLRGGDVLKANKDGEKPIDRLKSRSLLSFFRKLEKNRNMMKFCPTYEFARKGDINGFNAVLKAYPDVIFHRDNLGNTALHWAAANGKSKFVRFLLSLGSKINAQNELMMTPLHLAALCGEFTTVSLLLDNNAQTDLPDIYGRTPYTLAEDRERIARLLKTYGAKGMEVEILEACKENNLKKVKELLSLDPQLMNTKDSEGFTPLHLAVFYGHKELSEHLIINGADLNAVNNENWTPICYSESVEISNMLLSQGADLKPLEQKSLGILSETMTPAAHWSWMSARLPGFFHLEFIAVKIWCPPQKDGAPPTNYLTISLERPTSICLITGQYAGVEPDWVSRFRTGAAGPFRITPDSFTVNRDDKIIQIMNSAKKIDIIHGESPKTNLFFDSRYRLAFWAGSVGIIAAAENIRLFNVEGEIPLGNISILHKRWWEYWKKYWSAKNLGNPLPEDFTCESINPDTI